ncbi:leukocyte-specific transcript 1 protein isoform X2 [Cervus canadensis]|uniref:leukocyte-specific transcript 1 protein isoform X2 n=1 Tax=Cervus canadensis TaxID=1574408 RepID=UPI001CA36AFD|nr:leukocyte-specific transcript 1 protein isoform X2 [Cervus canadensis]
MSEAATPLQGSSGHAVSSPTDHRLWASAPPSAPSSEPRATWCWKGCYEPAHQLKGWGCSCSCLWSFCPSACIGSTGEVQASKEELHYASLLRLPEREGPDIQGREGNKEDPSGDYACIAKNKPT